MKNIIIHKNVFKRIVIIFSFLLSLLFVFAQDEEKAINITRLEKEIENSPVADKPSLLNLISKEYLLN